MKVYTLITQEEGSIGVDKIQTYPSFYEAQQEMLHTISEKFSIPMEELSFGKEYDDVHIGTRHAYEKNGRGTPCWQVEILASDFNLSAALLMEEAQKEYKISDEYSGILSKIYTEENEQYPSHGFPQYNGQTIEDFFQDVFIGEIVYQKAAEMLGGKTDEESTAYIFDFFNEMNADNGNWLERMLEICKGDEDVLKTVRREIDSKRPAGKKIFDDCVELHIKIPKNKVNILKGLEWFEVIDESDNE